MPLPSLPPELIGAIIHQLASTSTDDHVEEDERVRTLATCCQVNSVFLPFAQEALYGNVSLESWDTTDYALRPRSKKLLNTITSNPALAFLVHSFVMDADRNVNHGEVRRAIERVLKACTEVVELSIYVEESEGWGRGWIETLVMRYNRNLVSLTVGTDYKWKPKRLLAMLGQLPALRTLELEPPRGLMALPTPTFLRLKTFNVFYRVDVALLDHFLGPSQSSLVSLDLGAGFFPRQSFDFSPYTSLKTVKIELDRVPRRGNDGQLLFRSLGTIPSLQVLALTLSDYTPDYYLPLLRHIEPTRLLHHLPPSLRRIEHAHFLSLSTAYLLSVLNDTTCLPALESIGLYRGTTQGKDGRGVQRPVEELEMLEKAAEKRGVELVWSKEPMSVYSTENYSS